LLKHYAENIKRRFSVLPNVGSYIYIYVHDVKMSGFTREKKGKLSRYRPEQAQRVDRGIALSFRDPGARRG
jgi:hypothetical protein